MLVITRVKNFDITKIRNRISLTSKMPLESNAKENVLLIT